MSSKPFLLAAIGVTLLVPSVASAQYVPAQPVTTSTTIAENARVSKETTVKPPPNRMLLGAGAALFGIPYATSIVVAVTSPRSSNNNLFIPVVGPFIALGERNCNAAEPCDAAWLSGAALIADGLAQTAGVVAMGASLIVPEKVSSIKIGKSAKLTVAPTKVGRTGYGIGAVGEF